MLLYSKWLALPINKRHEIAQFFNIPKKGSTHVQDNMIVSDGYDIYDVENTLTVENLQAFLGVGSQETDINALWEMLVNPEPQMEIVIAPGTAKEETLPVESIEDNGDGTSTVKLKHAGGRPKKIK